MTRQEWNEFIRNRIVLLDGATGSNLQERGLKTGVCPEQWILEHKEVLIELQLEFLKAGTDILYAPTFSANRIKLKKYGLEQEIGTMNQQLVSLSKTAVLKYLESDLKEKNRPIYIAGNLTMTGEQLYPMGGLMFEELVDIYKEQIKYLTEAGVDLLVVETMMSLQECRAAVLAAKEVCDLPIMVTLTFEEDGRTLYGTDPKTAVIVLQSLWIDAIGVNCSSGPEKMAEVLEQMREYANIPLIAKPNAGLPRLEGNKTVYDMQAKEFAQASKLLIKAGASIIGGCCGSTKEHIRLLKEMTRTMDIPVRTKKQFRALTTERKTLEFDLNGKFMIVGERINPTGKKALQAELKDGIFDIVVSMAEEQAAQGADILDINMGMNGIDEKEIMEKAIYEVMGAVDIPLSIDSSHVEVIEAALRIYPGRALINSISFEQEKLKRLLPIAKKYGAMFILLPLSDKGLPKDIEEKKQIIKNILKAAKEAGLCKEDIIVDGLVNTIGANTQAAIQTMETIRYCREELELATICGLSNISFGLPERQFVNSAFLAFAIQTGLTMAIANPSQDLLINTAFAADLLLAKENSDLRYIEKVTAYPITLIKTEELEELKQKAKNTQSMESSQSIERNQTVENSQKIESGQTIKSSQTVESSQKIESVQTAINNQKINPDKKETDSKKQANAPIFEAVMKGKRKKIVELVKEELEKGTKASIILDTWLIPAINEVGHLFDIQTYFLPQLISSAETMKLAIEYLEPLLIKDSDKKTAGTIVIATVEGDIHDIGKNLVALMLKNYGFTVIDLGKDVASEIIIKTAKEHNADIIALSALMTTTMLEMKEVVRLRNEAGLHAKIMIGGAVITQSYCDEIGADGYSKDAQEAVVVAKRLTKL